MVEGHPTFLSSCKMISLNSYWLCMWDCFMIRKMKQHLEVVLQMHLRNYFCVILVDLFYPSPFCSHLTSDRGLNAKEELLAQETRQIL